MKSKLVSYAIIVMTTAVLLYPVPRTVAAACCAWKDRQACASCPSGYFSGCRTEKDRCNCYCEQGASQLAAKLARDDKELQSYIESNFRQITFDTQRFGFHDAGREIRITITPPQ
jgi:hypothetical protein